MCGACWTIGCPVPIVLEHDAGPSQQVRMPKVKFYKKNYFLIDIYKLNNDNILSIILQVKSGEGRMYVELMM